MAFSSGRFVQNNPLRRIIFSYSELRERSGRIDRYIQVSCHLTSFSLFSLRVILGVAGVLPSGEQKDLREVSLILYWLPGCIRFSFVQKPFFRAIFSDSI